MLDGKYIQQDSKLHVTKWEW